MDFVSLLGNIVVVQRLTEVYLPPVSNGYRALSSTKGPGCCGSLAVQPRDAHLPSSTGIAEGQLSLVALKFVMDKLS